jgi:hypothetical protein
MHGELVILIGLRGKRCNPILREPLHGIAERFDLFRKSEF